MAAVVKAKKIPELPAANSVANVDLIVIEKVGISANTTSYITGTNFRKAMCRGPYADDPTANSAGVAVGEMYYNSSGVVKVRLT
jgi:hypothetical protein